MTLVRYRLAHSGDAIIVAPTRKDGERPLRAMGNGSKLFSLRDLRKNKIA